MFFQQEDRCNTVNHFHSCSGLKQQERNDLLLHMYFLFKNAK